MSIHVRVERSLFIEKGENSKAKNEKITKKIEGMIDLAIFAVVVRK
jgi:hypothetical protein